MTDQLSPARPAPTAHRPPSTPTAHETTHEEATGDPLAPAAEQKLRIHWLVAIAIAVVHLLALTATVPWLFSWSGLVVMGVGFYLFSTLGINVGYHRLLTHRSFRTPRWVERGLTLLGLCNLQGSSVRWVATHRMHHKHSDERPDPHTPLVSFLWAHIGWLLVREPDMQAQATYRRFATDLCRDPFHRRLERHRTWLAVWLAHVGLLFAGGWSFGWALHGEAAAAAQLGLSWVVWGVFVRSVVAWHITWCINSVTHVWGYRNYETRDDSRNNWLLGLIGAGEGWHNNHHADQRSARHGHRWWELDATYWTIRVMQLLGLARDVATPRRHRNSRHDIDRKRARPE